MQDILGTTFLGNTGTDWLIAIAVSVTTSLVLRTAVAVTLRRIKKFAAKTTTDVDDLVAELGTQLWSLSETIRVELRESRRETPIRRRREARSYLLEDLGSQLGELGEEVRDRIDRAGRDIADRLGLRRP